MYATTCLLYFCCSTCLEASTTAKIQRASSCTHRLIVTIIIHIGYYSMLYYSSPGSTVLFRMFSLLVQLGPQQWRSGWLTLLGLLLLRSREKFLLLAGWTWFFLCPPLVTCNHCWHIVSFCCNLVWCAVPVRLVIDFPEIVFESCERLLAVSRHWQVHLVLTIIPVQCNTAVLFT